MCNLNEPESKGDTNYRVSQDIVRELAEIRNLISKTVPHAPVTFLEKAHVKFQAFVKYVGLPAVLLAAIIPVYELATKLIDYRNREYIRSTYVSYANKLFERGEYSRANNVLSSLSKAKELDALAQYTKSRILLETAYINGRQYYDAEDTTNILLDLHKERPITFPIIGGPREVAQLHLRLVDILIQRAAYEDALKEIAIIENTENNGKFSFDQEEIDVRKGKALVYLHQYDLAKPLLEGAILKLSKKTPTPSSLLGETYHAMGTMNVFNGNIELSITNLTSAEQYFRAVTDQHGLHRTFANLSLAYSANLDWKSAQSARLKQIKIARDLKDDLAIANAQLGLSNIERRLGNIDEALRLAKEAETAFETLANSAGLAAAYHNQANTYLYDNQFSKSIFFCRRALAIFEETRDPRGIAASFGVLGDAGDNLDNYSEAVLGLLGSVALKRHTGYAATSNGKRDVAIQISQLNSIKEKIGEDKFQSLLHTAERKLEKTRIRLEIDKLDYSLKI